MAKLNGVKTLDMTNGEVTRVEYDGAEYVKVGEFDGGTDVGNLLLCTKTNGDHFTEGGFYEVISEGKRAVIDNDGDHPGIKRSKFEVFRKAAAPSLDERVTELERKVEALGGGNEPSELKTVKRPAKVGERILITNAHPIDKQQYSVGDVFTVIKTDACFDEDVEVSGMSSFIDYVEYEVIVGGEPSELKVDGKYSGWHYKNDHVRATDEEVAQAKAEAEHKKAEQAEEARKESERLAETRRWASINRKPNEFIVGDIVKITEYQFGANEGELVEVLAVFTDTESVEYRGDCGADFGCIELITPVEARFDRE